MLAFLFEPIRIVISVFESLVVTIGALFVVGQFMPPGDYFTQLNRSGIFENRAQDSIPQTAVFDIVLEFFESDHDGKTPKCLLIGYDGARADALINTKDDPNAGTQLLKAEEGGGIYNMYTGGSPRFINRQDTSTAPGWMTMLTGKWANEKDGTGHGVDSNDPPKPADGPKVIFTELLEKELVAKTSYIVSWGKHFGGERASYVNDMAYCAENNLNAAWITEPNDAGTFATTLAEVQDPGGADMVMCILEYCDSAGHNNAFSNTDPAYVQSIKNSERDAAALIAAVKARENYANEEWLIIIASDHGGVFTGHGPQMLGARQVFLAANKPVFG